jgi:hypothetical protein
MGFLERLTLHMSYMVPEYNNSVKTGLGFPINVGRLRFTDTGLDPTNKFRIRGPIAPRTDHAPGSGYRRRNGI